VRVILGAGRFDWSDTVLTANSLGLFALSLFAQATLPLLARSFYARQNTVVPFVISLISVAVNLVLSLLLIGKLGVLGLVLGFSISAILNFALLLIMLKKKVKGMLHNGLWLFFKKLAFASLIMGVVAQYVKSGLGTMVNMQKFWGVFSQGLIAGLIGLIVFIVICYLFKLEEMLVLGEAVKRKFLKRVQVDKEGIRESG